MTVESVLNPIEELRALAGVERDVDKFELTIDGVRIRVSYSGGSSHALYLRVAYDAVARPLGLEDHRGGGGGGQHGYRQGLPSALRAIRPMRITLSPEQKTHVEGKESGGDIEHQTGDATFDRRVYIDAPANESLGPIFANENVRAAVLVLFDTEFKSIEIDNLSGEVVASCNFFSTPSLETHSQGRRGAEAFVRLARNLPAIVAIEGGAHAKQPLAVSGTVMSALGVATFCLAPGVYFWLFNKECGEDGSSFLACAGPGMIGFVIGVLAAILTHTFTKSILRRKYGGTSSSSRRINAFAYGLAVCVLWFTLLLVAAIFRVVFFSTNETRS